MLIMHGNIYKSRISRLDSVISPTSRSLCPQAHSGYGTAVATHHLAVKDTMAWRLRLEAVLTSWGTSRKLVFPEHVVYFAPATSVMARFILIIHRTTDFGGPLRTVDLQAERNNRLFLDPHWQEEILRKVCSFSNLLWEVNILWWVEKRGLGGSIASLGVCTARKSILWNET